MKFVFGASIAACAVATNPLLEGLTPRKYGAIYTTEANLSLSTLVPATNIASSFDAREEWPQCASVIGRIRDQSDCGACWAFGTTTAMNDRFCIATGNSDVILSPWDAVTNAPGQFGCGGGNPDQAWQWLASTGVVTGGDEPDVGKGTSCQPYQFGSCNHHEGTSTLQMCPPSNCPGGCKLPSGSQACESAYSLSYAADKRLASSAYTISGAAQMQTEIMTYGPITTGFDVYQNWEFYRGGVYTSTDASAFMGGHAVKIIGWGECTDCDAHYICHSVNAAVPDSWCLTNCLLAHPYNCPADTCACDAPYPPTTGPKRKGATLQYWLVANSWNPTWGENGFFRMHRGSNLCNIEGEHVSAGHVAGKAVAV